MKPAHIMFPVVLILASSLGAAENGGQLWWPQFRGPNSSGLGEGNPPVQFGPGQNVQWKTAVGSGTSSPVICGERVFLTQFDQASRKELLYSERLGTLGYYYSSPVAADHRIYIASAEGVVTVIEAGAKLNVLATNKLGSAILATPALAAGNIYVRTKSDLCAFGN